MKQKVLDFINRIQTIYFEQRNLNQVFEALDADIILFGFGKQEISRGYHQATDWLTQKMESLHSSFMVLDSDYDIVQLSQEYCFASGTVTICEDNSLQRSGSLVLCISVLCKIIRDKILFSRLHVSIPGVEQEGHEFFSHRFPKEMEKLSENMVEGNFAESEERNRDLEILIRNIPGGIFRCRFDEQLTILQMNDGFLSMFGYNQEEIHTIFHNGFWNMIDSRDRKMVLEEVQRQMESGTGGQLEYRVLCKNGNLCWVLDQWQSFHTQGEQDSFYCVLVDITEAKKNQEELKLSLERHQIIMNQANDIIFEWNIPEDTFIFSMNWEKRFGYRPLMTAVRANIQSKSHIYPADQQKFIAMLDAIKSGKHYAECEIRLLATESNYVWFRARITAQQNNSGIPLKAVGVLIDIDSQKRQAQRLIERAERDTLTKLYNKGTVQELVEAHLPDISPENSCALLMIDIDDFKLVNDSMGHLFGDAFLADVAHEIQKLFRSGDVVGRLGGDEFIVFLYNISDRYVAEQKARQIADVFQNMAEKSGNGNRVSCSIGIAMSPVDGRDYLTLYQKADYAVYEAKKRGKNQYVIYNGAAVDGIPAAIHSAISSRIDSEKNIRSLNGELVEYVFRILYKSVRIDSAVQSILEIVGRQFDISRAYIFENSEDDQYCDNTFEWCNDETEPEIDQLQHLSYREDLGGIYPSIFNDNGIFYCPDITKLPKEQYRILESRGMKSILQCAIRDNGKFKGYVGFDECRLNRYWTQEQIDALIFISEVLSTFLLRERIQSNAVYAAEAMQAVLEYQDTWAYVIAPKTYELLYTNRKARELVPNAAAGMKCYALYSERSLPCEACPAKELGQVETCKKEIYNPHLKTWLSMTATEIEWKGSDAILLSGYDITEYKR